MLFLSAQYSEYLTKKVRICLTQPCKKYRIRDALHWSVKG